jgi:signal transduction histidine kinase
MLMRLRVFVNMRWLAILGIIIATVVATFVFRIGFNAVPVYVTCALMAFYNLAFMRQLWRLKLEEAGDLMRRIRVHSNIHIFLDLLALTAILHFTGGIENPFLFYFVFHIILASIALHYKMVYMLATAAIALMALLTFLEYFGVIPHVNMAGFIPPDLYRQGSYIAAVLASLATLLYGTAYMAAAISGELRKRQRQVVQLNEQLLEEKTQELEESKKSIAELEEERNRFLRFLSIAAHDLKAPLAAIQSYIGVMLGGYSGELSDKQKNMLERSSQRINELLTLISDLLDIPRIETGQILQEMKDVSLEEIIKECLQEQNNLAREKGVKLEVEIPEKLPRIYGSAPRLQQVITNLVNNAINYTNEGKVTIKVAGKNGEICVQITDTGIGIPEEELPKVFEDFFRASNVDVKGTGLGLSITRRIVEAHAGEIWCESPCPDTGGGCRFTFTLPVKSKDKRR